MTGILIEHDADLTAQTNDRDTSGVNSINWGASALPRNYAVTHIMLKHGANVSAKNKNGLAPFSLAS